MKYISPLWGFCECGNDPHRCVKDASYTVTRPGMVFCSVRHDVLTQVSTGEGLRTFRLNIKVPSSWTVGPEDEGKLNCRQGQTSHMTWIFTNTAVRISQPPTTVLKRRQETTNRRCVKSQKSADLIYTAFKAWKTVEVYTFSAISMPRECTDRLAGCFLCCVVHMYASHFRYKKIIPQQVKGKKK